MPCLEGVQGTQVRECEVQRGQSHPERPRQQGWGSSGQGLTHPSRARGPGGLQREGGLCRFRRIQTVKEEVEGGAPLPLHACSDPHSSSISAHLPPRRTPALQSVCGAPSTPRCLAPFCWLTSLHGRQLLVWQDSDALSETGLNPAWTVRSCVTLSGLFNLPEVL